MLQYLLPIRALTSHIVRSVLTHADHVTIEKTKARFGKDCDEYAYALDAEHCENLSLLRFDGAAANDTLDAVHIQ